jgi:DNA-nicking Smr family endonuclease
MDPAFLRSLLIAKVLVVQGRGLGSPARRAVLKHGGAGAEYVLLRRERRREPFDIRQGAPNFHLPSS